MAKTYGDVVAGIIRDLRSGVKIASRRHNGTLIFEYAEIASDAFWRNQIDSGAAIRELTVSSVMHDDVYVN